MLPILEVARRAGVSQATLYRHFPDRYALTIAVIAARMTRLEVLAAANAEHPAAFRELLHAVLRTQFEMRPLVVLARRLDQRLRDQYRQRVVVALSRPLRSAQARGYVRADLVPDDLVLLLAMVRCLADAEQEDAVELGTATDRFIDLVLDGVFRSDDLRMGPS
ncbi:helix-turn-helix domain-containing protein [Micromonospora sonneratiae]|uniref:Helix-turn-helix domain-containing protein n=1 Tax=Micromonospora sonneratiae TaxID=1184706 RepID=A0ABW3Y8W7_9ACTN